MKTVRDLIASEPAIPDPPSGATHILMRERGVPVPSQWVLAALDGSEHDELALFAGTADEHSGVLLERASAALGYPVGLSSRIECEGGFAHYVTPIGDGL